MKKDRKIRCVLSKINDDLSRTIISDTITTESELKKIQFNSKSFHMLQKLLDNISTPMREFQKLIQPINIVKPMTYTPQIGSMFECMQKTMYSTPKFLTPIFYNTIPDISKILSKQWNILNNVSDVLNWLQDNKINIPNNEFFNSLTTLTETLDFIEEEKEKCKENIWHQLTEDELQEKERTILELQKEKEIKEREAVEEWHRNNEEILKLRKRIFEMKKERDILSIGDTTRNSLRAKITSNQITKLHTGLQFIFDSTLDQWMQLFSENLSMFEKPIILKSKTLSDVAILFYRLKTTDIIATDDYPSILEKYKVFEFQRKILTSKQIRKAKENTNFPYIGKNYVKINDIVENL